MDIMNLVMCDFISLGAITGKLCIGHAALLENTTGSFNTACALGSLRLNKTGSYNTAAGFNALFANTTGNYNSALGTQALSSGNYYN
jgi:hypothetical protein